MRIFVIYWYWSNSVVQQVTLVRADSSESAWLYLREQMKFGGLVREIKTDEFTDGMKSLVISNNAL